MPKTKTPNSYIKDGLLIVFSVLFALMLNKTFDAYQIGKQKRTAKKAIIQELERNTALLDAMYENHMNIENRLARVIDGEDDSLRNALLDYKYFNHWILTDRKSIAPEFASNTAWETALSTGIISEFDYSEVEELTRIYYMQDIIFTGTLHSIIDFLFQRETHDLKYLDGTLIQFKLRFDEITAQERYLKALYRNRSEELK